MLTINGLSPNNNISMLWRNDIDEWIAPFSRNFNQVLIKNKKESIINNSYNEIKKYYNDFYYKKIFSFTEFKMLLLMFNSYYIQIGDLTNLLGLDTDSDTIDVIEKFKKYDIINYDVDNIIEFKDYKVIEQFKMINQQLNKNVLDEFSKKTSNKVKI